MHVKKSKKRDKPAEEIEDEQKEVSSPLPVKKKKKKSSKHDEDDESIISNSQDHITEKIETLSLLPLNGNKKSKENASKAVSEGEQLGAGTTAPVASAEEVEQKKRRRRKRKSNHRVAEEVNPQPEIAKPSQVAISAPFQANKKRTHIHFGDDDSPAGQVIQTNGCNGNSLSKPKSNSNGITPKAAASPVAPPPQLGALLSLRSAVFSKTEQPSSKPVYNNVPPPAKEIPPVASTVNDEPPPAVKVDYTKYSLLTGPPRVGDTVAFKVN